jgi:cytochrome c553
MLHVKNLKKGYTMKKVLLTLAFAGCALLAADGKAIFDGQCKSCHGADGKMKALGKSNPVAGMAAASVEKDLAGYKAGTLNKHGMGAVMKGNAAKLSDADMKAVASYIATLK